MHICACSIVSDSLYPYGLQPTRLYCPRNSPGRNTRACCCFLLQGIFPTQGSTLNQFHHLSISKSLLMLFPLPHPLIISQLHLSDFSACCDAVASTWTHAHPQCCAVLLLSTQHMPSSNSYSSTDSKFIKGYCVPGLHQVLMLKKVSKTEEFPYNQVQLQVRGETDSNQNSYIKTKEQAVVRATEETARGNRQAIWKYFSNKVLLGRMDRMNRN